MTGNCIHAVLRGGAGSNASLTRQLLKEEYYKRYLTILVIIYILVIAAYIFLSCLLIKKISTIHLLPKSWLEDGVLLSFCIAWNGVSQKYLVSSVEYTAMIKLQAFVLFLFFRFYLRSFSPPGKSILLSKNGRLKNEYFMKEYR